MILVPLALKFKYSQEFGIKLKQTQMEIYLHNADQLKTNGLKQTTPSVSTFTILIQLNKKSGHTCTSVYLCTSLLYTSDTAGQSVNLK